MLNDVPDSLLEFQVCMFQVFHIISRIQVKHMHFLHIRIVDVFICNGCHVFHEIIHLISLIHQNEFLNDFRKLEGRRRRPKRRENVATDPCLTVFEVGAHSSRRQIKGFRRAIRARACRIKLETALLCNFEDLSFSLLRSAYRWVLLVFGWGQLRGLLRCVMDDRENA